MPASYECHQNQTIEVRHTYNYPYYYPYYWKHKGDYTLYRDPRRVYVYDWNSIPEYRPKPHNHRRTSNGNRSFGNRQNKGFGRHR